MKKITLIGLLILNSVFVNAQTLTVGELTNYGQSELTGATCLQGYELVTINTEEVILYSTSRTFLNKDTYKENDVILNIKTFNPTTFNLESELNINVKKIIKKDEFFVEMTVFNELPYVIIAKFNTEKTHFDFYLRQLNIEPPHFGKLEKKISSVYKKEDFIFSYYNLHSESINEKYEGYYYGVRENKKGEYIHNVSIFNRETSTWKDFTISNSNSTYTGTSFIVNDDGSFFFVARKKENNSKNHDAIIFSNFNNGPIVEIPLPFSDYWIGQVTSLSNSSFLLIGYNNIDQTGFNTSNKWFTQKINEDGLSERVNYNFTPNFITELWKNKPREKAIKNFKNFSFIIKNMEVLNTDNNSHYIVFKAIHSENLKNAQENYKSSSNSNIVVIHIDNDGNLLWMKNIFTNRSINTPTKPIVRDKPDLYFCKNNKLYLLYNEKNGATEKYKYRTVLISIDEDQDMKLEFERNYNSRLNESYIVPYLCFDLNSNSIFIYMAKGIKGQQIGIFKIEE